MTKGVSEKRSRTFPSFIYYENQDSKVPELGKRVIELVSYLLEKGCDGKKFVEVGSRSGYFGIFASLLKCNSVIFDPRKENRDAIVLSLIRNEMEKRCQLKHLFLSNKIEMNSEMKVSSTLQTSFNEDIKLMVLDLSQPFVDPDQIFEKIDTLSFKIENIVVFKMATKSMDWIKLFDNKEKWNVWLFNEEDSSSDSLLKIRKPFSAKNLNIQSCVWIEFVNSE